MYPYIHCSIIYDTYNSQDMEATQVPVDRRGAEEVGRVYSGL